MAYLICHNVNITYMLICSLFKFRPSQINPCCSLEYMFSGVLRHCNIVHRIRRRRSACPPLPILYFFEPRVAKTVLSLPSLWSPGLTEYLGTPIDDTRYGSGYLDDAEQKIQRYNGGRHTADPSLPIRSISPLPPSNQVTT